MKIGFIGLGNVGGKLAGSLHRNKFDLTVHDLDAAITDQFKSKGVKIAKSAGDLVKNVDVVITCLPSPKICSDIMLDENGILKNISKDKIWIEMSTTDQKEVIRLGKLIAEKNAIALEAPVSGGCHRAATGNIAIFVGGERNAFEKVLPILTCMGRKILHVGGLGSASILKVITNYLASLHLVGIGEALSVAKKNKIDLGLTYKAIKISSGNSFVNETETKVILAGSYDVGFTMDLVNKDINLFNKLGKNIKLELGNYLKNKFRNGINILGKRSFSTSIIKLIEKDTKIKLRAKNFPKQLVDKQKKQKAIEV